MGERHIVDDLTQLVERRNRLNFTTPRSKNISKNVSELHHSKFSSNMINNFGEIVSSRVDETRTKIKFENGK